MEYHVTPWSDTMEHHRAWMGFGLAGWLTAIRGALVSRMVCEHTTKRYANRTGAKIRIGTAGALQMAARASLGAAGAFAMAARAHPEPQGMRTWYANRVCEQGTGMRTIQMGLSLWNKKNSENAVFHRGKKICARLLGETHVQKVPPM